MTLLGLVLLSGIVLLTLRRLKKRTGFSQEWHRDIDRQAWTQGYDGTTWQADQVGKQAYRVDTLAE